MQKPKDFRKNGNEEKMIDNVLESLLTTVLGDSKSLLFGIG